MIETSLHQQTAPDTDRQADRQKTDKQYSPS